MHQFLTLTSNPVFTNDEKYEHNEHTTYNGTTFEKENVKDEILFGSYYFLDDYRMTHTLETENIVQVFSKVGGL